jgi:hypothetical protein
VKKLTDYRRALALIAILGVGGIVTACSAAPADEGDADGQSEVQNGATDEDAESQDNSDGDDSEDDSDEIPAWIADNFPIYPDSRVTTVSGTGPVIIGFIVNTGDGQAVVDWYKEQYSQNGWATDLVQNDGARFNAEHADGYMAVVGVTMTSTATIVTLTAHDMG